VTESDYPTSIEISFSKPKTLTFLSEVQDSEMEKEDTNSQISKRISLILKGLL